MSHKLDDVGTWQFQLVNYYFSTSVQVCLAHSCCLNPRCTQTLQRQEQAWQTVMQLTRQDKYWTICWQSVFFPLSLLRSSSFSRFLFLPSRHSKRAAANKACPLCNLRVLFLHQELLTRRFPGKNTATTKTNFSMRVFDEGEEVF